MIGVNVNAYNTFPGELERFKAQIPSDIKLNIETEEYFTNGFYNRNIAHNIGILKLKNCEIICCVDIDLKIPVDAWQKIAKKVKDELLWVQVWKHGKLLSSGKGGFNCAKFKTWMKFGWNEEMFGRMRDQDLHQRAEAEGVKIEAVDLSVEHIPHPRRFKTKDHEFKDLVTSSMSVNRPWRNFLEERLKT